MSLNFDLYVPDYLKVPNSTCFGQSVFYFKKQSLCALISITCSTMLKSIFSFIGIRLGLEVLLLKYDSVCFLEEHFWKT